MVPGCGKKEGHVVAKVGKREITAEDINGFFERNGARFPSAKEELKAKRDFLDSLINQHLLIIGAYEHNLENQEEVVRVVDGEKNKFLLDVLFEEKILSQATPSEAEIKDWYTRGEEEIKASHILVATEEKAQEVLASLKGGGNFEQQALENSIDPSARRNQGDLGWLSWGFMPDNFQEAAYKLKTGEISAPVKSEYGYHIIKISERRKAESRPSYAEAKGQIRGLITERRKQSLMRQYYEELRKKYPVSVEKPTCEFVLNKLATIYPETIGSRPRWRNNIDLAQLDKDEQNLVLGKYTGGQLTIGQYLTNLRRVPEERRPDFDKYDSLVEVVFQMSFMDILTIEAKESGLDKKDSYLDKVSKFKELAMADVMRNDSIPYNAQMDEAEVRGYYDSHPDEFTNPMRFHLLEIQTADSATAVKYMRTITSETEFRTTATKETLRPSGRQSGGDLGVVTDLQYPEFYEAARGARLGQMAGPVKSAGRYSVLWIKERLEPEKQDFELSRRRIVDKLTKEKGDALYRQWIDDMKKRVTVEVYDDVLEANIDRSVYEQADSVKAGG
jgi:peptidyl-prolyl cis-trans isomerase C